MLDVPLDYDAMQKVGHVLGSGAILVMNETVRVADYLASCLRFFRHESCGNCNPCRNGTQVLCDIAERLKQGKGYPGDVALMEELAMSIRATAFCPLGQSPASPITSALRYFRPEIEACIDKSLVRPQPVHTTVDLVGFAD
jgi:NADH:ubiquinone oxidoreductase subunit F (NADH-binding)